MSDERVRAAYRDALARRDDTARDRAQCPSAEALESLAAAAGDEMARLVTLDHAMACRAGCREELELLRALSRAHAGAGARRVFAVVPPDGRRWLLPAIAAALVAGVGLRQLAWRDTLPVDRAAADGRPVLLVSPADGGALARSANHFAWRSGGRSQRYTLEILRATGDLVAAVATTDTTYTWTPSAALPAGTYEWWIRSVDADGVGRHSSVRRLVLPP